MFREQRKERIGPCGLCHPLKLPTILFLEHEENIPKTSCVSDLGCGEAASGLDTPELSLKEKRKRIGESAKSKNHILPIAELNS